MREKEDLPTTGSLLKRSQQLGLVLGPRAPPGVQTPGPSSLPPQTQQQGAEAEAEQPGLQSAFQRWGYCRWLLSSLHNTGPRTINS